METHSGKIQAELLLSIQICMGPADLRIVGEVLRGEFLVPAAAVAATTATSVSSAWILPARLSLSMMKITSR